MKLLNAKNEVQKLHCNFTGSTLTSKVPYVWRCNKCRQSFMEWFVQSPNFETEHAQIHQEKGK